MKKEAQCYRCEGANNSPTIGLFEYTICETCKSELGLFQDKTIQRYVTSFEKAKVQDKNHPTYAEDVSHRLSKLEKDYISKRIKLLHIQERI